MNFKPLYQNLNTSFVNLAALIRHLQRQDFIGRLELKMPNYEAELLFGEGCELNVREVDRAEGRVSGGKEAYHRLIIRAKQPGGTIDVFEAIEESGEILIEDEPAEDLIEISAPAPEPETAEVLSPIQKILLKTETETPPIVPVVSAEVIVRHLPPRSTVLEEPTPVLPVFEKPKTDEKETMLQVCSEVVQAVEYAARSLQFDFSALFRASQAALADDYPFLEPAAGVLTYENGRIVLGREIAAPVLVKCIGECLRRAVETMNRQTPEINQRAARNLMMLAEKREAELSRCGMMSNLEKIVGRQLF